jgi:hypothetical protein
MNTNTRTITFSTKPLSFIMTANSSSHALFATIFYPIMLTNSITFTFFAIYFLFFVLTYRTSARINTFCFVFVFVFVFVVNTFWFYIFLWGFLLDNPLLLIIKICLYCYNYLFCILRDSNPCLLSKSAS